MTAWRLGISAGGKGGACLLEDHRVAVAVLESVAGRTKDKKLEPSRHSDAIAYCLDTAGITASDLAAVSCTQGMTNVDDIHLNRQLQLDRHRTPLLPVSAHLALARAAVVCGGLTDATVLVISQGADGSTALDFTTEEASVSHETGGWGAPEASEGPAAALGEHLSLYQLRGAHLQPLSKHLVAGDVIETELSDPARLATFRSLSGMMLSVRRCLDMPFHSFRRAVAHGDASRPPSDFFEFSESGAILFKDVDVDRLRAGAEDAADFAASARRAFEEALLEVVRRASTTSRTLCVIGTGAETLNLFRAEGRFNDVIGVEASDEISCVGAAYEALWRQASAPTNLRPLSRALGRAYSNREVSEAIATVPSIEVVAESEATQEAARLLADGRLIGFHQGRTYLGPFGTGTRILVCDPRSEHGHSRRALAILEEHASDWLSDRTFVSRAMLREDKRAALGRDSGGSYHIHLIDSEAPASLRELVREFSGISGLPLVSWGALHSVTNALVDSPLDALYCTIGGYIDYCLIGDLLVGRSARRESLLDLCPTLCDGKFSALIPTKDGVLEYEHLESRFAKAASQRSPRPLESTVATLLMGVDAKSTLREIAVAKFGELDDDQAAFIEDLVLELAAARIIEFA